MEDELYQQLILEHFKSPRVAKELTAPTKTVDLYNPLCGDKVTISIKTESNTVSDVAVHSQGCAISCASGSMMAEAVKGRSIQDAKAAAEQFRAMMRSELAPDACNLIGDAQALQGVRRHSARIRCAVLAWEALEKALLDEQLAPPKPH